MAEIKTLSSLDYIDEMNGYYKLNASRGSVIMNNTGKYIVESIINAVSLGKMVEELSEKCGIEQMEAKIFLFEFLTELQYADLIDFDDCFFSDIIRINNNINIAGELEYAKISQKIQCNLCNDNTLFSYTYNHHFYNKYNVRTKGFYNSENYFFDIKNNEICNIIGVQNLNIKKSPIQLILLQSESKLDKVGDLCSFFLKMEDYLKLHKKYKIKVMISKQALSNQMKEFLRNLLFEKEGCFKLEDGINDYYVFSKFLR